MTCVDCVFPAALRPRGIWCRGFPDDDKRFTISWKPRIIFVSLLSLCHSPPDRCLWMRFSFDQQNGEVEKIAFSTSDPFNSVVMTIPLVRLSHGELICLLVCLFVFCVSMELFCREEIELCHGFALRDIFTVSGYWGGKQTNKQNVSVINACYVSSVAISRILTWGK